jgi:hypothetical protein
VLACNLATKEREREIERIFTHARLPLGISFKSSEKSFNNKKILMFPVVSPFRLYRIACLPVHL